MFSCKFCLNEMDKQFESRSHYGMCKGCYTKVMKYRRMKAGAGVDTRFIRVFERQCKHNRSIGGYAPKIFTEGIVKMLTKCPCCGDANVKIYPYATHMCYDCGSMENTYRTTVGRLEKQMGWNKVRKDGSPRYGYDKALDTVVDIERVYEDRMRKGLRVPALFMRRKGYEIL